MEKLVKKFEEIIVETSVTISDNAPKDCAEEAKRVAIEFAKRMFRTKIVIQRNGYEEGKEFKPKEFEYMEGYLIQDGNKLFDQFIKEEYK